MKNVVILGSTGSIGSQALNIIRKHRDKFKVAALVANSNVSLLYAQAMEFKPEFVGFSDESVYNEAVKLFPKNIKLVCGRDALTQAAVLDGADTVVAAVVGMRGLTSVIEAVKKGKRVCLANKESLVAGGEIVMPLVKKYGAQILPVDSEHSAVWQCLEGNQKHLKRIILTASGGMFFGKKREDLKNITIQQATSHPNWSMGKKITVDSSTMMNKGLEIIEACRLFDTFNVDYIIHRESIIHSMIELTDGSMLAQMTYPNMEYPIALALGYPDRLDPQLESFKFDKNLTFNRPDEETFPLPRLCIEAVKTGGTAPCIVNSANEAAVELFLGNKIGFLDIADIVEKTLYCNTVIQNPTLNEILLTHEEIYSKLMRDYR